MIQKFTSRSTSTGSTTVYNSIQVNGTSWSGTESAVRQVVAAPGTLRNLRISIESAPGSSNTRTFTVVKNGAPTSLAVTISDSATTGFIATPVSVEAGDVLSLQSSTTGSGIATTTTYWSLDFASSNTGESLLLSASTAGSSGIVYCPAHGRETGGTSAPAGEMIVATAGTISHFYVRLPTALPSGSRTFTLRKNGSNTAVTCSLATGESEAEDVTNSISVSPGDRIVIVLGGSAVSISAIGFGMRFTATTDGEAQLISSFGNSPSTSALNYQTIGGISDAVWDTTESDVWVMSNETTLKSMTVYLSTAPGTGNSWTFTLMKNGVETDLTLVISDSTKQGTIDTDVAVSDGDFISFRSVPTSSPNSAGRTYWGFTTFGLDGGRGHAFGLILA